MAKTCSADVSYQDFDAKEYLNRRFTSHNGIIDEERGIQPFYLKCYHEFYQDFHSEWNPTTATVLELGGGPVIYPLISAAPYVSEITFADYAKPNIAQVKLWVDNAPQAHDWSPYFNHVVCNLEGNKSAMAVSSRQEELRSKVKKVVKADVSLPEPKNIVEGSQEGDQFDIVSSNFCAEVVCKNASEYGDLLRRVKQLVRPGGFFCSLISIEESWYINGGEKLPHLYLTKEDVILQCKNAGMLVRHDAMFDIPKASQDIINDCKGIYFFVAQRVD